MKKINIAKVALGLGALALVAATPSPAFAGKSAIPSLNGSVCKAFGGTWKAGKAGLCQVNPGPGRYFSSSAAFVIDANTTLQIVSGRLINRSTIINNGTIIVDSAAGFTNSGILTNNLSVVNNGIILNGFSNTLENNGTILNQNLGGFDNNGGTVNNNSIINNSSGSYVNNNNTGTFRNLSSGVINNNGNMSNNVACTMENQGTINNFNLIYNFGTYSGNQPTGYPMLP